MDYEVFPVHHLDRSFNFVLNSRSDHIQGIIRSGRFYEIEELELISRLVVNPRRILDVGANLGNHSLYFAHFLDPVLTVPVEPNPIIVPLLRANLALNWHPSFDLSLIGSGLADQEGFGTSNVADENNLGGARLLRDSSGSIPIVKADQALNGQSFDLIKIDVEGMENLVIAGMADILTRSSALVFVEVLFSNIDLTISQMQHFGYVYRESYQRYGRCINLIFERR